MYIMTCTNCAREALEAQQQFHMHTKNYIDLQIDFSATRSSTPKAKSLNHINFRYLGLLLFLYFLGQDSLKFVAFLRLIRNFTVRCILYKNVCKWVRLVKTVFKIMQCCTLNGYYWNTPYTLNILWMYDLTLSLIVSRLTEAFFVSWNILRKPKSAYYQVNIFLIRTWEKA